MDLDQERIAALQPDRERAQGGIRRDEIDGPVENGADRRPVRLGIEPFDVTFECHGGHDPAAPLELSDDLLHFGPQSERRRPGGRQGGDGVADLADGLVDRVDRLGDPLLSRGVGEQGVDLLELEPENEQSLDHVVMELGRNAFAVLGLVASAIGIIERSLGLGPLGQVAHGCEHECRAVDLDRREGHGDRERATVLVTGPERPGLAHGTRLWSS